MNQTCKWLFLNETFLCCSCFVLLWVIRSWFVLLKSFLLLYICSRVCVRPGVCAQVCACMRVCARGVWHLCNTRWVWYLCIPVAKRAHFLRCDINITLFYSLLRICQLVYAVKTVTYKEKPLQIETFLLICPTLRGPPPVTQYVYIHKHTEVLF